MSSRPGGTRNVLADVSVAPAYHNAPAYSRTLGPEVADLCDLVGFGPDPEQRLILDDVFAIGEDGRSAAFEVGVVCARQNLKTGSFKQCALGWLFISEVRLTVWSAHEFSTAQEAHRELSELIDGSDYLRKRVKRIYFGNGSESIELRSGQRVLFRARTKSGGRGLSGDRVVLDEAFALQPGHMGALLPTLAVRPDPQVVYGSSAGLAHSDVLRGLRDRGRSGSSSRLAYLEWCAERGGCVHPNCPHDVGTYGCVLDDPVRWQAANPLLGRTRANGTGLTVEYVAAERQALPAAEFGRERLGWWDEPGAADAFGAGRWEACAGDPPAEDLTVRALAVAVSYDLTHAAIVAAANDRAADVIHVQPLQHGPGTGWVVERVKELTGQHPEAEVVVDRGGPAADLIPKLQEIAGVAVHEADTRDVLDACSGLWKRVQERRVRHGAYKELNDAASRAVRRPVGDRWAWGRKQSDADISALEGATLAAWLVDNDEGVQFF